MLSRDSTRKKLALVFFIFQGTIDFKNGDHFKGEFHHNEIQGIGELTCVSGLMYQGEWRHSKVTVLLSTLVLIEMKLIPPLYY